MTLPAVYYSAELDVIVVVRPAVIDHASGKVINHVEVEWEWMDMMVAQVIYGRECEPFERGNFEYIGEL